MFLLVARIKGEPKVKEVKVQFPCVFSITRIGGEPQVKVVTM